MAADARVLELPAGVRLMENGTYLQLEGTGVPTGALYADAFNRADGALVAPWVAYEGSHSIAANRVVVGPASPNTSYYNQTFSADQWAEADLGGQLSSGSTTIGVGVRITAGGDLYYLWCDGSLNVQITKRVGGSYATLATGTGISVQGAKVRLEVQGTTLRAYVNGTLAITTTDAAIASGRPGIISANGAGAALDNFRCGDLPYTALTYVGYRTFDSNNFDFMTFNIAESASYSWLGPGAAVMLCRRTRSDGQGQSGGYQEYLSGVASGGGMKGAVYFHPNNHLDYYNAGTGYDGGPTYTVADGWIIVVVQVDASLVMTVHGYKWGAGACTHTQVATGVTSAGSPGAGGFFEVGQQNGYNQCLAADVAAVAYWRRSLTDAEIETLNTSLATWTALSPNHLWRMDAATVTDSIGTATQRTITGTTLSSNFSPLSVA